MSLSRNDHIEPKVIENSVVVPAGLQIGVMTLGEHQDYLKWMKLQRPLLREEAIAAGHRPKEVYAWFGPLHKELEDKPVLELVAAPVLVPAQSETIGHVVATAAAGVVAVTTDQFAESRAQGYTGDSCLDCGNFTIVNNGTCLMCVSCGRTTGCT